MFRILAPDIFVNETTYVFQQLFRNFLGTEIELIFEKRTNYKICSPQQPQRYIEIETIFFYLVERYGFAGTIDDSSIINEQRGVIRLGDKRYETTVLFGSTSVEVTKHGLKIGSDIIGASFFLLAQVEDVFGSKVDVHDRFCFETSQLTEHTYDYPIVDEYIEILRGAIHCIFGFEIKYPNPGRLVLSSDLDFVTDYRSVSLYKAVSSCFRSLRKYKCLPLLDHWVPLFDWMRLKLFGVLVNDRFSEGVRAILLVGKKYNCDIYFFGIPISTHKLDGDTIEENATLRKLLVQAKEANTIIGVHPGYASVSKPEELTRGVKTFLNFSRENILHARMHFLRWNMFTLPPQLEKNGVHMDHSLGFADFAGFRVGTSKPFYIYDWSKSCTSTIIENPLICMDATVLTRQYGGRGFDHETLERISLLAKRCRRYNGNFTILWHNTELDTAFRRKFFDKVMSKVNEIYLHC